MIWPPGSVGVRAIVNDSAPKRVRSNRSGADSQRWTYSPETPAPGKITGPVTGEMFTKITHISSK